MRAECRLSDDNVDGCAAFALFSYI